MTKAWRRLLRSLLQLIGGGGLTAVVTAVAGGLSPYVSGIVLSANTLAIVWVQNYLEGRGVIPTLLPTSHTPVDNPDPLPLIRSREDHL